MACPIRRVRVDGDGNIYCKEAIPEGALLVFEQLTEESEDEKAYWKGVARRFAEEHPIEDARLAALEELAAVTPEQKKLVATNFKSWRETK